MPKTAVPDWAAIRHGYEATDAAVADIATAAGVSRSELEKVRKREKWIRQKPRGVFPLRRPKVPAVPSDAPASPASEPANKPANIPAGNPATPPQLTRPASPPPVVAPRPRAGKPKSSPNTRRDLLARLVAAISLKLEQLERRMAKDLADLASSEAATATDHERETRAIGALIDNLGKVTEMESGLDRSAGAGKSAASDIAGEADRYRRELAERLAKIVGAATPKP